MTLAIYIRVVHNYFNAVWAQVQGLNLILDTFPKILQKVSARLDLSSFRDFDLKICMKLGLILTFSIKVDHYVTMMTTYVFWRFI
jgi:hypothetical protein